MWFTYHTTHPCKVYKSTVFCFIQRYATIITINFRTVPLHPKETLNPLVVTLRFPQPPSPKP